MKPYEHPGGAGMLSQPTSADRIIGATEKKRSTKTWISSERAAIILSLIKNHSENLNRTIRKLHQLEHTNGVVPEEISDDELYRRYPGCRAWANIHQELVEHFASHQGFSLKVVARLELLKMEEARRAESSILQKEADAAAKP